MARGTNLRRRHAPGPIVDNLESRVLLTAVFPTPAEQYLVELINRARANPVAEVQRLANDPNWAGALPDLNEGLPAGTIPATAKQPLAINLFLTDAVAQAQSMDERQ